MEQLKKEFIIPPIDNSPEQVSKFETASPWPYQQVGFNIQNHSYPVFHTHEYYEILVVLSGSILHRINNNEYSMHSGDCCLIRPEDRHCLQNNTNDFLSVNFMFSPAFFTNSIEIYPVGTFPEVMENSSPISFSVSSSYLNSIQEACLQIQTPLNDPTSSNIIVCKALISELIHTCTRIRQIHPENSYPDWLQKLILRMQSPDNFSKTIAELLVDIPYSYSFIQKQFKRLTGVSLLAHFNSLKLAHAKDLLASTDMSISNISYFLGYDSISHFNHLFKRSFNMSPSQYRKATNTVA